MVWVKLDDGFLTNPKIIRAGLEGRALYVAGLCYCAGGLTDGVIPREALAKLAMLADVVKPAKAAAHLVSIGLWEPEGGGYRVHDYLQYQLSAEAVRKERERVAEWRTKRNSERLQNGVPDAVETRTEPSTERVRNGVQNAYGTRPPRDDVPARPGLRNSVNGVPKEKLPDPSFSKWPTGIQPGGDSLADTA